MLQNIANVSLQDMCSVTHLVSWLTLASWVILTTDHIQLLAITYWKDCRRVTVDSGATATNIAINNILAAPIMVINMVLVGYQPNQLSIYFN